jgi:poly-gamma-glutamate synthesis protein (capsule biosynthesis protein)
MDGPCPGLWRILAAPVVLGVLLCLASCRAQQSVAHAQTAPPAPVRATLAFAGDLLIHQSILDAARDGTAYRFKAILAPVAPFIACADYATANLETRLAGEGRGYTGYPCFNSPTDLGWAARDAGFDMMATANNHCLDKGYSGLAATLDNLETIGLAHCGTARSDTERHTPVVVDVKGMKIAFLNYTAMTNGITLPAEKAFAVNYLKPDSVISEAAAARAAGAELVLALLHFGNEYQRAPTQAQRALVAQLMAHGVDAIVAAHPHVVQPIEQVTVSRDGMPITGVVAYSLGNFLSAQRDRYRDSGIVLYLDLVKDPAGVRVDGVSYLPVYVQRDDGRFRVLPLLPGVEPTSDVPLSARSRARIPQVREELSALLAGVAAVRE